MDSSSLNVNNIKIGKTYKFSVCQIDDCKSRIHKTGKLLSNDSCKLKIQWQDDETEILNCNRINRIISEISGSNKSKNYKKSKKNKKNKRSTKRYRK
jgi:hypothetical protein